MASKRTSFTTLVGGTGGGEGDGADRSGPPTTALLHTLASNPGNPRDASDYSTDDPEFQEMQETFRTVGQLQPLAVVSRSVFLAHYPHHAQAVGEADWVVITGNRRLAVARSLGWTKVDIRVQDHLGDGEGTIREAIVIENGQRRDLDPCKEAAYLADLVTKYGSQEAVARRIGKSQMYVSNRVALLDLAPDLQDLADRRVMRIKLAEQLAKLPTHEEQRQAWDQEQQREQEQASLKRQARQERKARPTRTVASPPPETPLVQNPVLNEPSAAVVAAPAAPVPPAARRPPGDTSPGSPAVQNPVLNERAATAPPAAQEAPADSAGAGDDPEQVAAFLIRSMPPSARARIAELLMESLPARASV
jgi:ParB family chromosome partitioning protein